MVSKKKKGAALIVVLMIITFMALLGVSALQVSLSESKQASSEDKKLQAHYLAQSGAEATLKAWEDAITKPSGACNTVYLNYDAASNKNIFEPSATASNIGKFDVTVTPPIGAGTQTIITSVGTVGSVAQAIIVTINKVDTVVNIPPVIDESVPGESLGWYTFTSGQINTGGNTPGPSGKTVKLKAKHTLKIPNKNSPAAYYEAEKMVFDCPVQVWHNAINLTSKVIAFNEIPDFSYNDSKGSIVLNVLDHGVDITQTHCTVKGSPYEWGIVYFGNVGYYYKKISGGITLANNTDITANITSGNLIKMNSDDENYVNPFIGGTKIVTSYFILWSKE